MMDTSGQIEDSEYVMAQPRGFAVSVIGDRDENKYRCSQCKLILRDPVQSFCGHRYCKKCIQHLTRQVGVTCPSCLSEQVETEDSILDMTKIFPDNATKRELSKLRAVCPNHGCEWTGILRDYEGHEKECPHRVEHCVCGRNFVPLEYAAHLADECPFRPSTCQYCGKHYRFKNTEAHLSICPRLPVTCHRCSEEGIPREMMESHLKKPECRPRVRCPYACGALVEEGGMEAHIQVSGREHLDAVFSSLSAINSRIDQGLVAEGGAVGGAEGRREEQMETGECRELEEVMRKDEVLESAIVVLQREIGKTLKKTEDLQSARQADRDKISALETRIQSLNIAAVNPVTSLEDLPNYDGSFLWRISNFAEKRQQALNGSHPGITSAPFYTSKAGYKMCGRVYLDGDGMGKGSHISVFIVVMKGNYDSLLRWPFRQKVSMTLLDQNIKRRHVTDAFRPDPSSASFQRPRSDMNTASGCPMFVPLSDILRTSAGPDDPQFLNEDTIFIKLHVDTTSLTDL